jgi:hypothetical protein
LERGISQLDFELSLYSRPQVVKFTVFVVIGSAVVVWEAGRLNGDPTPWMMLLYALASIPICLAGHGKMIERVMQRRRALESMLAGLEEDVGPQP